MTALAHGELIGLELGHRYTLSRPLAVGGMAEIYIARQRALAGFEKDVVVKVLQARYQKDERVRRMFLDEARIGAALNHPNIVHVYDVGEHDGLPFIAMEWIRGEELSELCRRGLELGAFLPFAHAVDLMRQAAEGMGYFHARRDEQGQPLEIVHRDISPSNLLVTSDGGLKIIDFGIARSRLSPSHASKMLPGKANYMAPEQARGEVPDHRADIYSLGIVLYEITLGRRLFKGKPEEVQQLVAQGKVKPPTHVRREFPPALEAIVMKALEPHPEERYQNAYELASDLQEFLHESRMKSGPFRIAQYLDELGELAGRDRRPELVVAGEAWVDDEAEDALDFGRQFNDVKASGAGAGAGVKATTKATTTSPSPSTSTTTTTTTSTGTGTGGAPTASPAGGRRLASDARDARAVPREAGGPGAALPSDVSPANTAYVTSSPPEPAPRAPSFSTLNAPVPHHASAEVQHFGQAVVEHVRPSPLPWVLLGAAIAGVIAVLVIALR